MFLFNKSSDFVQQNPVLLNNFAICSFVEQDFVGGEGTDRPP